ncbi:MAG: DUF2202 domain-containing protein [Anaerolineaceae bacterium]|nr:DUF2202 domain-containing protein [Anaerolineaceae bacterium]
MKKNLILTFVVVSIFSLALMACAPADVVEASTDSRRGPFGDPLVDPNRDDATLYEQGSMMGAGQGYGASGAGMGTGYALTPLSAEEADGLMRAIEEEYTARALYESVIADFGNVIPFTEIALSEASHATALVRQAEKYGLDIPIYNAMDSSFASLEDACQAGVDAEIVDAALYDELMAFTTHTDLNRVYTNLQRASLNSHLPQFELCN